MVKYVKASANTKLNAQWVKWLRDWGYEDSDLEQIYRATLKKNTKYELSVPDAPYETGRNTITKEDAIRLLGEKDWLSGIARSAFHRSAVREANDGSIVYFDSRNIFI